MFHLLSLSISHSSRIIWCWWCAKNYSECSINDAMHIIAFHLAYFVHGSQSVYPYTPHCDYVAPFPQLKRLFMVESASQQFWHRLPFHVFVRLSSFLSIWLNEQAEYKKIRFKTIQALVSVTIDIFDHKFHSNFYLVASFHRISFCAAHKKRFRSRFRTICGVRLYVLRLITICEWNFFLEIEWDVTVIHIYTSFSFRLPAFCPKWYMTTIIMPAFVYSFFFRFLTLWVR